MNRIFAFKAKIIACVVAVVIAGSGIGVAVYDTYKGVTYYGATDDTDLY